MICKKCGTEFPDGMHYCPTCGKTFGKTRVKKILFRICCTVLCVVTAAGMLLLGIGLGAKGIATVPVQMNFMQTIADKLRSITTVPLKFELSEEEINTFIRTNSESFYPVNNLKLAFGEGENDLILSGSMDKSGIETLTGGNLPAFLMLFLPQTSTLRMDAAVTVNDEGLIDVHVTSFRVSDVQVDSELLATLQADKFLSDTINQTISTYTAGNFTAENICIKTFPDGIRKLTVAGSLNLSAE